MAWTSNWGRKSKLDLPWKEMWWKLGNYRMAQWLPGKVEIRAEGFRHQWRSLLGQTMPQAMTNLQRVKRKSSCEKRSVFRSKSDQLVPLLNSKLPDAHKALVKMNTQVAPSNMLHRVCSYNYNNANGVPIGSLLHVVCHAQLSPMLKQTQVR